jgi:hypothetical protein
VNGVDAEEYWTLAELNNRQPVNVAPPWKETVSPALKTKLFTLLMVCHGVEVDKPSLLLSLPFGDT